MDCAQSATRPTPYFRSLSSPITQVDRLKLSARPVLRHHRSCSFSKGARVAVDVCNAMRLR
jgi:hypothetical protein